MSVGAADGMEKSYSEILKLLGLMGIEKTALRGSPCYLPDENTPVDSPAARDLAKRALENINVSAKEDGFSADKVVNIVVKNVNVSITQ
jgi:hypothetical protein